MSKYSLTSNQTKKLIKSEFLKTYYFKGVCVLHLHLFFSQQLYIFPYSAFSQVSITKNKLKIKTVGRLQADKKYDL